MNGKVYLRVEIAGQHPFAIPPALIRLPSSRSYQLVAQVGTAIQECGGAITFRDLCCSNRGHEVRRAKVSKGVPIKDLRIITLIFRSRWDSGPPRAPDAMSLRDHSHH